MENYRPIQGQDYGILRKKEGKEEELFVFGYSCKIYEDYDKSLYVDQGKHLIPWLGDETLKIDRYDCRGALNDLVQYLPKSETFDLRANLSNEEKRIEQLCDQERFRALTTNEDEEVLYQEEELKRLQQAINSEKSYSEVGFSYDNENKSTSEESVKEKENEEEEDEPFIPPYQLDIPVGMKIPKTKKHHEIVERTAFFINEQGPQMEILLKIKQAGNAQFNFLSFDNELHPYYRHLLMAVKTQRYKPTPSAPPPKDKEIVKETVKDDTYLHPSLVQNSQSVALPESAPKIPTISYKPSQDCTYSALVNRIKETQTGSFLDEFKKKYGLDSGSPNNSGTTEVKNSVSTSSLPLSALTKSARRRRIRKEKSKAAAASFKIYYADEEVKNQADEYDDDDDDDDGDDDETSEEKPAPEIIKTNENNDDSANLVPILKPVPASVPVVEIPPSDVQLVIDKMASYVAKNGRNFEEVVRTKGDPRFSFLGQNHVYNPYYKQKVELYLQLENPRLIPAPEKPPPEKRERIPKPPDPKYAKKPSSRTSKPTKSSKPIPICFSIKKPKDQEALEIRSALPYEESEGDNDEENEECFEEKSEEKSDEIIEKDEKITTLTTPESTENTEIQIEPPKQEIVKKTSEMTLEKWAQERLRAKLVTAVKEKLAAKTAREKDKQLQAERRKKAAEFINLLQKENLVNKTQLSESIAPPTSNGKKDSGDVITIPSGSSSDSDSVVSVPLSDEEDKQRQTKRKIEEPSVYDKHKRRNTSHVDDKSKYSKVKYREHIRNQSRSPPYSKYSFDKYKKYDRERKSHSKKKKHRLSRSEFSSSFSKKAHKDHHKSKRSRYTSDDTDSSDSAASSSSSDSKR